jgi:hypothetical protein
MIKRAEGIEIDEFLQNIWTLLFSNIILTLKIINFENVFLTKTYSIFMW